MRLAQNLGNMLDIRKAYANVSRSAMLRAWNRQEVEPSERLVTTTPPDALRAAFSGWARAVYHDLAEHAHDSDSSDEVFPDAQGSTTMGNSPPGFEPCINAQQTS